MTNYKLSAKGGSAFGGKTTTLLLFILEFTIFPWLTQAKTVIFEDQSFEINPVYTQSVNKIPLKAQIDLVMLSKHALLGQIYESHTQLFDQRTMEQIEQIENKVNQVARNANLVIKNKRATEFDPGNDGRFLDLGIFLNLLKSDMININLPVLKTTTSVKLADTNNLGIAELVARGESNFTGSPKNRIHNIETGIAKFDGLIIDPGEEFSFNKYLGDVDAENGFLPELVIKKTGVTPEFGGGLCQVSSTVFRVAMNAGLPITARRNHSFAVQYYAPQGTDATIYPGSQDLKFINDLPSSLLIHPRIVGKKLYFELYGTKDSRTVAFEGPFQYDKKPDGSMKAVWTRFVTLNGQTAEQIFKSTYRPPAEFHREEQATTPNPQAVNLNDDATATD